jgi:flavin reductase
LLSSNEFRSAMAQLGTAVTIVTTDGPAGRYGMTVSAVCSVTDDPPTVLVCLNRQSEGNRTVKENGVLTVNILASDHEQIAARFARHEIPIKERFVSSASWVNADTGCPQLTAAAAVLNCRIAGTTEAGSHSVFFCSVESVRVGPRSSCLVYHDKSYHPIERRPQP